MKNRTTLILKVKEALPKDVGRAMVRIDPEDMKTLGVEVGDYLRDCGKKKNSS